MEEGDRKGSGGPVIASRGEAIQLLFWIATGLKPLAMTVVFCQAPSCHLFWQEA